MKRVEDIVVGDFVGVMDEFIKTSEVEVVDVKGSDLTIKHGSLGLGVVDYSSVTHINGQPVIAGVDACVAAATDGILSIPEMDELRAHSVNHLLTKAQTLLADREDALPGIDPDKINEVSAVLGALMDNRIIEVVR